MKAPAFQFYPKDFTEDPMVKLMSRAQLGSYILLMCTAWAQDEPGMLPNDDEMLAGWAKCTNKEWARDKAAILRCFKMTSDGRLMQKRMVQVAADLAAYRELQREKGRASGEARRRTVGEPDANRGSTGREPPLVEPKGNSSSSSASASEDSSLPRVDASPATAWGTRALHDLWMHTVRKTPSGNFQLLGNLAERISSSAQARNVTDVEAHATRLVQSFVAVVDGWRNAQRPRPQKSMEAFEKHFAAAEEVIDGERDPRAVTVSSGRSVPEPAQRQYEDLGVIADRIEREGNE